MALYSHREKLEAAILNPKCAADVGLLNEAKSAYEHWVESMNNLTSTGAEHLSELVRLLNMYKDYLEVDLIAQNGSEFLKRQKGQLKSRNRCVKYRSTTST